MTEEIRDMSRSQDKSLSSLTSGISDELGIESSQYIQSRILHLDEGVDIGMQVSYHLFYNFYCFFIFFTFNMFDFILCKNWFICYLTILTYHFIFVSYFMFF